MSASESAVTTSPATQQVERWLATFGAALEQRDSARAVALFTDDSFWRDLVAFTWNLCTLEGRAAIGAMLDACLPSVNPGHWRITGTATEADGVIEAWFDFSTSVAQGHGHLRLRDGRCWTLLTTMAALTGFEEKTGGRRALGATHGATRSRQTWLEKKQQEEAELGYSRQPYVVIVGGGQGGIALAARLRRLAVPTIVIERSARAGDSWRKRYRSLCLHDPVWFDHLPYLPFPDDWPVFSPKDKIGDWLEMYTRVMELNYWASTECQGARFDEATHTWEVRVLRDGRAVTLRPAQLVLATGVSGFASTPQIAGADTFAGTQVHSSQFPGGDGWSGRRCVVLGSNNSAHDICAELWEHGADVTMIQRSSTLVARSATLLELGLGSLYSEQALASGITTEKADLIMASLPYRLSAAFQIPVYQQMAGRDADFYARLRAAGFMLDFAEDGAGLFLKYLRRGSGYYIDVGASELVADGRVKLRSGVSIARIAPAAVVLSDGSELAAELIVYATGYGGMNNWAAQLISQEVADTVGRCWGLGSGLDRDPGPWEGELRNLWKPTAQPGLWFHGGNLQQSRHHSQFLALQLKARLERIPTPVYGQPPVWHRD